ncbi:MAG TPA: acyl-CoA thioesterase [Cellvibrionaceae bacterium]
MFVLPAARVEIEIPFHDVDALNIVWHGHYCKYFEIARCVLLKKIHYTYEDMRISGYAWPVIDLKIKYVQPLVYQQSIAVEAKLSEWEHRLKIDYCIFDAHTGRRHTKGHTTQVALKMSNHELQFESPPILLAKLNAYAESLKC